MLLDCHQVELMRVINELRRRRVGTSTNCYLHHYLIASTIIIIVRRRSDSQLFDVQTSNCLIIAGSRSDKVMKEARRSVEALSY